MLEACRATARRFHFAAALDLGCGTGLAGDAFRPFVDRLVGVDLSPEMIAQARAKGIYDRLLVGDMLAFRLRAQPPTRAMISSWRPTFCLFRGPAWPSLHASAEVLEHGGLLAFTVETHDGDGVVLGEKLRYAHGADHVRTVA